MSDVDPTAAYLRVEESHIPLVCCFDSCPYEGASGTADTGMAGMNSNMAACGRRKCTVYTITHGLLYRSCSVNAVIRALACNKVPCRHGFTAHILFWVYLHSSLQTDPFNSHALLFSAQATSHLIYDKQWWPCSVACNELQSSDDGLVSGQCGCEGCLLLRSYGEKF